MPPRRRSRSSLYEQIADSIRQKISSGELVPGDALPSEQYMADEHDVGRDTVRDAMQALRNDGLIDSRRGYRSRVRKPVPRERRPLSPGDRVIARMPTPEEREEHDMSEGVPVVVVDGTAYPADRFEFTAE